MVSAYPGLFYPGQGYPGQGDATPPPPPGIPAGTSWGAWVLALDGTWIRRQTRVLVWDDGTDPGYTIYDGATGTDLYDAASGTDIYDFVWPLPSGVPVFDGNGTTDILDGGGTATSLYDGNG